MPQTGGDHDRLGRDDDPRPTLDAETIDVPTPAPGSASATAGVGEQVGSSIGPYRLLQLIGEGGFGAVYMAEQREPIRRKVALKIIKLGMDTRQVIARFEAERQALALMDHPNIARVLDAGATSSGRPYFVMELVRGVPITAYCDTENLSNPDRIALFTQVCAAVQHAHQKGVIHRDIKPSNVLVTLHDGKPVPKVIDFGIAKATSAELTQRTLFTEFRQFVGTPEYMSPEQAEMSGLDLDTRADIYSLGVLLYELLTGTTPFDGRRLRKAGLDEIQRIIREEDPERPSTRLSSLMTSVQSIEPGRTSIQEIARHRRTDPNSLTRQLRGDIDWIVMKCLEKDRTRRYDTAAALADDLARHLRDEPVTASPPRAAYRLRKFARRHRGLLAASGVVMAALVVGLAVSLMAFARSSVNEGNALRAKKEADDARAIAMEQKRIAELARDEAQAVTRFLADMLAAVEPEERGRDVTVRAVLDAASEDIERRFPDQPLVQATLRHTIGQSYLALSDNAAAARHLAFAMETRERLLGVDHLDTIVARNSLATLAWQEGRVADAERLYRDGLEAALRVVGENHERTIGLMSNLATMLQDLERIDASRALYERALAAADRSIGRDHWVALSAEGGLANLEWKLSRFQEAHDRFADLLVRHERVHGPDHPITLKTKNNLAAVLNDLGRDDEAERLHRDTLDRRVRVLGESHRDTIATLINLAILMRDAGRFAEGEPLLRRAIEAASVSLGAHHPLTLEATLVLAQVIAGQGRLDEAFAVGSESLDGMRTAFGDAHARVVGMRSLLTRIAIVQGRAEEAVALARDQVDALKRAASLSTADAETLNNAAWELLTIEPEEARDPVAALGFAIRSNDLTHHANPAYLDTLAMAHHANGDAAKAVEVQTAALQLVPEGAGFRAEMEEHLRMFEEAARGGTPSDD
jgi:serine/threonine protein kinase/tetratricopeptide (TPR) repeat protein